ncbi:hypothetical protein BJX61DRAFT_543431 [Aspergillus egyptiacus]|nr:hypothetical protein BJX61DRAFT_543431 [Aspergillus egyptiacus]
MKSQVLAALLPLLLSLTSASPCIPKVTITTAQIEAIAPKSVTCTAADVDVPQECATAEQAAPALSTAFTKYGITSKAEQAAILGLIAFESGEFRYNRNHFPGVPGQGTRNMQSPAFNKLYAESLPELEGRLEGVKDDPAALLDLLLEDPAVDFGSAAWFLTTQCEEKVRVALRSGSEEGWRGYIVDCVGTEANQERRGYWSDAVKALGS